MSRFVTSANKAPAMTDEEKHEWCRAHGWPSAVLLHPTLYEKAERLGVDMRWYVETKPIPRTQCAGLDD